EELRRGRLHPNGAQDLDLGSLAVCRCQKRDESESKPFHVVLLAQRAAIGEARLLAGDELEQGRLPALGGLARAGEGAGDVLGPLDPLAPAAHGAPQIRVASADVTGAVL